MEAFFSALRARASSIDATLGPSTDAAAVRAQRLLTNLQGKLDRALRKREAVLIARAEHIIEALFPGGALQERRDNILPMMAATGPALLDELLEKLDPLAGRFTVLVEA